MFLFSWVRKALVRLEHHLRRNILTGLAVLVPAVITYLVVRFVVEFVDGLLRPLTGRLFHGVVPGLGLAITVVALYIIGLVVTTVVGRQLVQMWNGLMERVPGIRVIYRTARQVADVFNSHSAARYRRVVFLEFPRPGLRSIGLVTGEWRERDGRVHLVVYIPTVPNPTSGFLVVVPADQVEETSMSVEDALKVVVSAGVLAEEVARRVPAGEVSGR
ncbi:MAG: DUF502 domain-containing protein [Dehalococcoidia bacterium]|nr:DUF502 domain-containing protein [Dehalococcoidia bacterium]MDW8120404.1 DUF502 domain-containing protein [Chloroflexota bacterium]